MQRTNIYLEARHTRALDLLAESQGVSRAEALRRVLDRALAGGDDALAADRAAIDLSFGALAQVELEHPEREPDGRSRHLAQVWERA